MALAVSTTKELWKIGDEAPILHATGNVGVVRWETNHGTLSVDVGADNGLAMPNQSWYGGSASLIDGNEPVNITVRDDETVVVVSIDVYATFPFQADWGFQAQLDIAKEISKAEDNSESYRILSGPFAAWPLAYNDREHTEYLEALAFWAFHGYSRWFYLDENGFEETQLVRFDSAFQRSPLYADGRSYGFSLYSNDWRLPTDAAAAGSGLFGEITFGEDLFGG